LPNLKLDVTGLRSPLCEGRWLRKMPVSNLRAKAIALIWHLMRLAKALKISNLGTLKIVYPMRVSDAGVSLRAVFFSADKEIRAANIPSESVNVLEDFPPLGFRNLHNVSVTANRRFSGIISGKNLLLPAAADPGPWRLRVGEPTVSGVLRQDESSVLVWHHTAKIALPKAIFVGSWSAHNWYHWIIDTLPSIYLANYLPTEFDSYPILLDEVALAKPAWLEPLSLVLGNREVASLPRDEYVKVSDLLWIDSPSSPGPLPMIKADKPSFRVHPTAMREYRSYLISSLNLCDIEQKARKRLFLGRKSSANRPYNQDELIAEARKFDYEPIFLEEMSFADSVKVMLEAESVIGPHGAGWANSLFCRSGTTGIMWTWRESLSENWFSNVAELSGMVFKTIVTDGSKTSPHHLSTEVLKKSLQSIHTPRI